MTRVPFLDLRRELEEMRPEIEAAIARVLTAGQLILGEEVERFETAFAAACGARHAVGVASGTDAITIALQAVGIGPGDEVITVANTCVPTIVGIEQAGAVPVLVDPDSTTFTIDPERAEQAITPRTRALVPVHLYGQMADMRALVELCESRGLALVEDCAQAHGARFHGAPAGSFGHAASFSFYPTKNLGALGDGGAVVSSDEQVATRARMLRTYGEQKRFVHVIRGRNSRLDALQAAVLAAKLPRLESRNERRRALARRYSEAFAETDLVLPTEASGRYHVYHLYVVRSADRDGFRGRLEGRGVQTAVHYPLPVHLQPAYRDLGRRDASLSVAEALATEIVSLPLYPELTDEEVSWCIEAVLDSCR